MKILFLIAALVLGLLYILSPIDIFPDYLGLPGRVDDILLILFFVYLFRKIMRPESIKNKAFREFVKNVYGTAGSGNADFRYKRDEQTGTKSRPPDQSPPGPDVDARDPYAVLGIKPGASREEIRDAYHNLSKKYHPDRVNHLGPEFQALAHQKFINLKNAYEAVRRDPPSGSR
ncbi:MAG: DnaJ domain-containing protein [Candidatus Auribacterota bacterium]|nr:DnaJ domain-containing protein [Candidatus Auribacterota bacterium]